MEPTHFDDLARAYAYSATRRSILGALLGSLAFLAGIRRTGAQSEPPGIPLGGRCELSSECSQYQGCYETGPILCADNGIAADGPLNCCLGEGGLCGGDAHCCGGLLCLDTGGDGCGAGTCQVGSATKPTAGCGTPVPLADVAESRDRSGALSRQEKQECASTEK
jgi:hypothetical protein